MMPEPITVNVAALEPLYAAWEEPDRHRVRADSGDGVIERRGRRPSGIAIAQGLRAEVKSWRESYYPGASETTRHLLNHWFGRAHDRSAWDGPADFRYYFCQREAIETLVYLKEVRQLGRLSQVVEEFGGPNREVAALGITDEEDAWTRYAFKMATGSGKTKVMSLAIVWSYFHALRESESPMARHFVVIAPNLTVFERLKQDFRPEEGGYNVFDKDPLIPAEWRGDWNMSVILQDEASGAHLAGTLYLTNIHRLYDPARRRQADGETYEWMGPKVSKATALDTGAELRERITEHERVMLINDEAHHVWDPGSSWNDAIRSLHETIRKRSGGGLVAQLDFSATPKDNNATYFKHIVCDTPLGEAVDAGIVKTPIIGRAGTLVEQTTPNAAYRFEAHLRLGYQRWLRSKDEWFPSGKKPLLFVMCENTDAANDIATRLNGDAVFKELNGRTINLHTNLKGKVKQEGKGKDRHPVFVVDEKEISDEDLRALRKLSRELDSDQSPYYCIVSVLMLREGWDVRNVTTIVPLRPYSSKANILPEQTLGRGLRRMTPPGQATEVVTVVEHEAFARLYQEELAQEGLDIQVVDIERVPATTVSIFPDPEHKDLAALDIEIPGLTPAHTILPALGPITEPDVRQAFSRYQPLAIGERGPDDVQYEGRHLITGELVEQMKVNLTLLESGIGAISFFEREIEYICKVRNTHQVLGPLLQWFFEDLLFGPGQSIFDTTLVKRLSDSDVREHVRGTFVPLVRARTLREEVRAASGQSVSLQTWKPFQVTSSERRPVERSSRTLFNLVPCHRSLEVAFVEFCTRAPKSDVAAFAKNAGPQALRIDYLNAGRRLAFYTPDFFVRTPKGNYYLVETKGQLDADTAAKARAAVEWCKSASTAQEEWTYLFIPEAVFQRFTGDTVAQLESACRQSLIDLIDPQRFAVELPLFAAAGAAIMEERPQEQTIVDGKLLDGLPPRARKSAEDAIALYQFLEKKPEPNFAPVFTPFLGVLDEFARAIIVQRLSPHVPVARQAQLDWFAPHYGNIDSRQRDRYNLIGNNLRRTVVDNGGLSPIGLLRNVLDYALNDNLRIAGVFESIKAEFRFQGGRDLLAQVSALNDARNTKVAHQFDEMTAAQALKMLQDWAKSLAALWSVAKPAPTTT